jgi:hypothetical protein
MIDRRTVLLAAAFAGAAGLAMADTPPSFDGVWHGALQAGPQTLRLRFEIHADGSAVLTSLDQGGQAIPAHVAERSSQNITLEAPGVSGRFSGRLETPTRIAGTWTQGGSPLPLTLDRGEPPRQPGH